MQKHILIIPAWFSTEQSQGVFIREHARMIRRMDYRVGLIFVQKSERRSKPRIDWWTDEEIDHGVYSSWHPPKVSVLKSVWLGQYRHLYNTYAGRYGTPDLIHAHGYVAGIAARHLSRRFSIPFVLTEHSSAIPMRKVPGYHAFALRSVYRDASALIAVSGFLAVAMTYWTRRGDIHVVFNPVDSTRFVPVLKTGNNTLQLICVGGLEPNKRIGTIIKAIAMLPSKSKIVLRIVGSGPLELQLREMSNHLGIANNIQWLGEMSIADVALQIASSDILVSASQSETFGLAIAEALMCGVPVISTDSGGPAEFLREDIGMLLEKHDPAALSSAIQRVIDNLSTYNVAEIREYAKNRFDFPVIGARIDQIYHQVVNAQS